MASKLEKGKKKPRASEWSKSGSFMHKPERGWIHPDTQLSKDGGICYGVRYIGCIEVKESMRSLDFDTRTALAREAIARVCEAAGLKTVKKRKGLKFIEIPKEPYGLLVLEFKEPVPKIKKPTDKKLLKMLGESPIMQYAGSNINLSINTECLNLVIMESGEVIAKHQMPGISFASGGDTETLDFVSYVAKDSVNGRACHVLECGGGLSEDVITTIGQAFELRFKEYLKNQPKAVEIPDRTEGPIADGDAWGEDENEYYNDRPDARPPLAAPLPSLAEYSTPKSNLPVSDGTYSSVKEPSHPTYDTPKEQPLIDLSDNKNAIYDNKDDEVEKIFNPTPYDNKENVMSEGPPPRALPGQPSQSEKQPFDMDPLTADLPPPPRLTQQNGFNEKIPEPTSIPSQLSTDELSKNIAPVFEEWYHGNMSRKQAEKMLQKDGDFLVRKSSTDPNQFVLSGKQNGIIKHLLLVDPDGVVRTKDHTFESVPHLIKYHRSQNLPIISQESELHLIRPVSNNYTNC